MVEWLLSDRGYYAAWLKEALQNKGMRGAPDAGPVPGGQLRLLRGRAAAGRPRPRVAGADRHGQGQLSRCGLVDRGLGAARNTDPKAAADHKLSASIRCRALQPVFIKRARTHPRKRAMANCRGDKADFCSIKKVEAITSEVMRRIRMSGD